VVEEFRNGLRGELLCPEDEGYDESRSIWNAMIDRRPALIARCAGAADVINCVNFARDNNLPVSVRGGGHNVAGNAVCHGGIMIDLSRMKGLHVDPVNRTARAEPGLTWGEFSHETQAFGLATNGGICSDTGIAGVTLGGGFGWLMRKHGLSLDNLVSVDIVCADGRLRKSSATENEDLFFGIRGTHSNLGVVTSLEYRLHPVGPMVLAGMVLHPLDKAEEVLKFYREYNSSAPDEMSAWAALLTTPDGQPMVALLACYVGAMDVAEKVVQPLKEFGPPLVDMIWKSGLLKNLDDEAIATLAQAFEGVTSPYSSVLVEQLGGAVGRVGSDETAFSHRTAPYDLVIMPMWTDAAESDVHTRWADELWRQMQPFSSGGVYVNYLSNDEGEARVKAAYGANYQRLVALKNKYDPTNLFRINQNIKPTG
jgi:FAD/FMN-containing dehydrogenase